MDANTHAMNKYLANVDELQLARENFMKSIDDDLVALQEIIENLRLRAKDFKGFDMTFELQEALEDLV